VKDEIGLERAIDGLGEIFERCSTAIISSEYFFECPPAGVATLLSAVDVPITKIICYLRRQDVICAAGYAEEVRSFRRHDRVRGARYIPALDWYFAYMEWRKAVPAAELIFRNFDRVRSHGHIANDFANLIGVDAARFERIDDIINPSLSSEMVEIARLLNESGRALNASALLAIQEGMPCTPFGFSEEVTAQFERAYVDSNRRFAALFPGQFDDFATPGWRPRGNDFEGALPRERIAEAFACCFRFFEEKSDMERKRRSLRYLTKNIFLTATNRAHAFLRDRWRL
jgi:hypothetical protein